MKRRILVDAMLSGIIAVWVGMAAGLVPELTHRSAEAAGWGQTCDPTWTPVPCATLGNCGCAPPPSLSRCIGAAPWSFCALATCFGGFLPPGVGPCTCGTGC